ncbi:hypothetical protein Sgleb_01540 [Streptomyces glebosus]|uniref:Uncharacterized protein n=1 Tax=Streptomyces glebosus TaxID=249580 RepID=A0A640SLH5_9ACTN|nr:hypothetical protein Sgleb_01540 [Streptomyces glebosus]GHG73823.1 hypothetical protein GCM10010513_47310 [Streptomyces glebosus]
MRADRLHQPEGSLDGGDEGGTLSIAHTFSLLLAPHPGKGRPAEECPRLRTVCGGAHTAGKVIESADEESAASLRDVARR